MLWRFHPYVLVLLGTAVLSAALFAYGVRQLPRHESRANIITFAAFSLSVVLWSFGAALQLSATDFGTGLLFHKISLIGSETAGPLWLLFVIAYLGHDRWFNGYTVALVGIIPLLFILALPTNPWSMVYINPRLDVINGISVIRYDYGPLYALTLANSHVTPLVGMALVSIRVLRSSGPYRQQALLVLLSAFIPISLNLIELFDVFPPAGIGIGASPTPLSISATVILLAVALFYYRILELVPIARTRIIETMTDGYIVVDDRQQIVDVNPAARTHLGIPPDESLVGRNLSQIPPFDDEVLIADGGPNTVSVGPAYNRRYLEVVRSPITEGDIQLGGSILLRDVTAAEKYRRSIEREQVLNEEIRGQLIQLASKRELLQSVCDRLLEGSPYSAVWIGGREVDGELRTGGRAGASDELFDALETGEPAVVEPHEEALRTGEPTTFHDLQSVADEDWAKHALDHGYRSLAIVPLVHRDITRGVLAVYAAEPDTLDEPERQILDSIGGSVAFALNAIEQREALMADEVVELTVSIRNPEHYLTTLTTTPSLEGRSVLIHEIQGTPETPFRHLLRVSEVVPEQVIEAASEQPAVSEATLQAVHDDESLILLSGSFDAIGLPLTQSGGVIRSIHAEDGHLRVVAEFSSRLTLNRALEAVSDQYAGVEVISIVELQRAEAFPDRTTLSVLSAKERQALETAFFSGFYDRPQGQTAEEVSDSLGIARTTFLHHVRNAERKILAELLR